MPLWLSCTFVFYFLYPLLQSTTSPIDDIPPLTSTLLSRPPKLISSLLPYGKHCSTTLKTSITRKARGTPSTSGSRRSTKRVLSSASLRPLPTCLPGAARPRLSPKTLNSPHGLLETSASRKNFAAPNALSRILSSSNFILPLFLPSLTRTPSVQNTTVVVYKV